MWFELMVMDAVNLEGFYLGDSLKSSLFRVIAWFMFRTAKRAPFATVSVNSCFQ